MFAIPVENRFESDEICEKMTKKWPKWGSGAGREPNGDQNRSRTPNHKKGKLILEVILDQVLPLKFDRFFMIFWKGTFWHFGRH